MLTLFCYYRDSGAKVVAGDTPSKTLNALAMLQTIMSQTVKALYNVPIVINNFLVFVGSLSTPVLETNDTLIFVLN
jgi:hypothetical protein